MAKSVAQQLKDIEDQTAKLAAQKEAIMVAAAQRLGQEIIKAGLADADSKKLRLLMRRVAGVGMDVAIEKLD